MPYDNRLGREGSGHQAAQDRLGAGRVYHCMNSVGQMWRAFDLMVKRAIDREVHGGKLETKQFIQGFIADSYMDYGAGQFIWRMGDPAVEGYVVASDARRDGQAAAY